VLSSSKLVDKYKWVCLVSSKEADPYIMILSPLLLRTPMVELRGATKLVP